MGSPVGDLIVKWERDLCRLFQTRVRRDPRKTTRSPPPGRIKSGSNEISIITFWYFSRGNDIFWSAIDFGELSSEKVHVLHLVRVSTGNPLTLREYLPFVITIDAIRLRHDYFNHINVRKHLHLSCLSQNGHVAICQSFDLWDSRVAIYKI